MAIRVETNNEIVKRRVHAVKCEGTLSCELGEVIVEMLPTLLEIGTPLNNISQMLWGKQC